MKSVENYYEDILKGKNEHELMCIIRGLKNKVCHNQWHTLFVYGQSLLTVVRSLLTIIAFLRNVDRKR